MDIVVEDGTGLPTANAYASVAEVDALLSVNIYTYATWVAQTDTVKANLVLWATRILEERVIWNGKKADPTSGLSWPRIRVKDRDGYLLDDNIVPKQVKNALAILVNHLLVTAGDPEVANTSLNLTMLSVDVITIRYDARILPERYPPELGYALRDVGYAMFGPRGQKNIVKC